MCRFLVAAIVLLSSMSSQSATADEPDAGRETVRRALSFLAKDARAWRDEHNCASCHHAALAAWAMHDARQSGHAVDETLLSELSSWMADTGGDGTTSLPRPATAPQALNTKALYFSLALVADPQRGDTSQAALERFLTTIKQDQTASGSWSAWPETRPPMFGNSDQSMTALALLALSPSSAAGDESSKLALERGLKWLAAAAVDEETQSLSLRLVLWKRSAQPRAACDRLVEAIKKRQNEAGGWSQTAGMAADAWATGQALYALAHADLSPNDSSLQRGRSFLIRSQRDDGSWPMTSRPSKPGGGGADSLVPITGAGTAWAIIGLASTHAEQSNAPK